MYPKYFGLKEPSFSIAPDPHYLFLSDQHREALAHLLYGAGESGGFVLLTGEVGTGKTTVCRAFLEQLPEDVDVALILNPAQTANELLQSICDELRIPVPSGRVSTKVLVDQLNQYLLTAHANGRRPVLIIDEAQNLRPQVMEQVRLLTNLETTKHKLLQIFLIGQPELRRMLETERLRQLNQRITARFHLTPLGLRETADYIRHRVAVAGVDRPLFTASAIRRIHRFSGGVPRLINILCDRALLGTCVTRGSQVTPAVVARAIREVRGEVIEAPDQPPARPAFLLAAAFFIALGAGWLGASQLSGAGWERLLALALEVAQRPGAISGRDATADLGADDSEADAGADPAADPGTDPGLRSATAADVPDALDATDDADAAASLSLVGATDADIAADATADGSAAVMASGGAGAAGSSAADPAVGADLADPVAAADSAASANSAGLAAAASAAGVAGVSSTEAAPTAPGGVASLTGPAAPADPAILDGAASLAATAAVSPSAVAPLAATGAASPTAADLAAAAALVGSAAAVPMGEVPLIALASFDDVHLDATLDALALPEAEALRQVTRDWGRQPAALPPGDPCAGLRDYGLRCERESGKLSNVRYFDLPALLEVAPKGGVARYLALSRLGLDEGLVLAAGGPRRVPVAALEQVWRGDYLLVWQPPPSGAGLISWGAAGEDVRWLRRQLGKVPDLGVLASDSPNLDSSLVGALRAFQAAQGLMPDGIAGPRTLIKLYRAAALPGIPSLTGATGVAVAGEVP